MSDAKNGSPEFPQPEIAEAGRKAMEQAISRTSTVQRMRLGDVKAHPRNVVQARFRIPYNGYTGKSSILAAEEISRTSVAVGLEVPTPVGLQLHRDTTSPTSFYGVPVKTKEEADLLLEWKSTTLCTINFIAFLQALKITIPAGYNMMIDVKQIQHAELGHCVQFSWGADCFVAMSEAEEDE